MNEIQEDDLKEVLNTLNIGELREIARTVNNKVTTYSVMINVMHTY